MATEPRLRTQAISVGAVAARALQEGARGTVRAVFQRSLYATLGKHWCCIGPPALAAGPLNVLCTPWSDALTAQIAVDDPVAVAAGALRLGACGAVALAGAPHWRPPPPPAFACDRLAAGLAACDVALPAALPPEGLARLILSSPDSRPLTPVLAAARAIQPLCAALVGQHGDDEIDPSGMAALLGLGPGLTPAGDDFLGGVMVALALAGRTGGRNALWRAIAPHTGALTTAISAAHLAAAAEGHGSAALHALLNAMLANDAAALPPALAAVAAIGHTSGWDALAGALTVLRALAAAPVVNRAAS